MCVCIPDHYTSILGYFRVWTLQFIQLADVIISMGAAGSVNLVAQICTSYICEHQTSLWIWKQLLVGTYLPRVTPQEHMQACMVTH